MLLKQERGHILESYFKCKGRRIAALNQLHMNEPHSSTLMSFSTDGGRLFLQISLRKLWFFQICKSEPNVYFTEIFLLAVLWDLNFPTSSHHHLSVLIFLSFLFNNAHIWICLNFSSCFCIMLLGYTRKLEFPAVTLCNEAKYNFAAILDTAETELSNMSSNTRDFIQMVRK